MKKIKMFTARSEKLEQIVQTWLDENRDQISTIYGISQSQSAAARTMHGFNTTMSIIYESTQAE
jgi:hypothetical protein